MRIRTDTHCRIERIKVRAASALLYLQLNGPANLATISEGIQETQPRTRYALVTLRQDKQAHVQSVDLVMGEDRIPRFVSTYVVGPGVDARLPAHELRDANSGLDFESTKHLQPIYALWGQTRTPDYDVSADGQTI